jgi:elongation of very long chain fatty acids protein 4
VYLIGVYLASKWSNAQKEPMDLKLLMRVYNAICVGLAGYVVYGIVMYKMTVNAGTFVCNPIDTSSAAGKQLAYVIWVYYAQKYVEMADTFIFIFRQSWRQVTFLHVYHHSSITMVTAAFLCFDINGDCVVTAAVLNSGVHVLMYSHYFLSSFGVKTWWRSHLTKLQLLQFTICFVQPIVAWTYGPKCGYPDFLKAIMVVYQATMFMLFMGFYMKAYGKKKVEGGKKAE